MQKYLLIIASILILGFGASSYYFYSQNKELTTSLVKLSVNYNSLSDSYRKLVDKENYSISLSPKIETRFASVLGSSRQITLQYYFTMNGNTIKLNPDSTAFVRSEKKD